MFRTMRGATAELMFQLLHDDRDNTTVVETILMPVYQEGDIQACMHIMAIKQLFLTFHTWEI